MVLDKYNIGGKDFHLHRRLKIKLDNIKRIIKKNWDCCFIVDGDERSGKSTLGLTCLWYLSEGKLTIKNFAKNVDEAKERLRELPDKTWLIIDEGSLVLNSRDSITNKQKELLKILDVVGQKNMIMCVIAPSVLKLNWDLAVRRSRFLLHVYTDNEMNRGRFSYYGSKAKEKLFNVGKKNYGKYTRAEWNGSFDNFNPLGDEYLEQIKRKTLNETLGADEKVKVNTPEITKTNMMRKALPRAMLFLKEKGIKPTDNFLSQVYDVPRVRIWEAKRELERLKGLENTKPLPACVA